MRLPSLPRRALLAAAAYAAQRTTQKSQWKFGVGAGFVVFDDHDERTTGRARPIPVPCRLGRETFLLPGARFTDSLPVTSDGWRSAAFCVARLSDPLDRLVDSKH
jgi:hypothetical protein